MLVKFSVALRVFSNFYPIFRLCNNCHVMNTRKVLFWETTKINQFMQFSIDTNTAKLLFIHLVLTQYGCLSVHLPFHRNIRQLVCHFNFLIRKFLGSERYSASDRRKFDIFQRFDIYFCFPTLNVHPSTMNCKKAHSKLCGATFYFMWGVSCKLSMGKGRPWIHILYENLAV